METHPNILFARYSDHDAGDLHTGSDLSIYAGLDSNGVPHPDFTRLVEWLRSIPTRLLIVDDADVSWVFGDEDGQFWFRMFWQAEVHDHSMDRWEAEEEWDEGAYHDWHAMLNLEEQEYCDDLTFAAMMKVRTSAISPSATMWSQDGRRSTTRNTARKKRHYA
ncbi:MAG: hypothetical protein EOP83_02415 [Verrucomicrobiaceae bacterium]|nr:MAG: hypothetical protein EOP83_02415 [Verrucomicrobiaceae bacterium]